MRTSVWYRDEEKQPDMSGYYLTYRGWGIGGKSDGDSDHGYLYFYTKTGKWYEYESEVRAMHPRTCIVYYWSDAGPDKWTDDDPPRTKLIKENFSTNPALINAWNDVENAVKRYQIIRKLIT